MVSSAAAATWFAALSDNSDKHGRFVAEMTAVAGTCPVPIPPAASVAQEPHSNARSGPCQSCPGDPSHANRVVRCLTAALRMRADRVSARRSTQAQRVQWLRSGHGADGRCYLEANGPWSGRERTGGRHEQVARDGALRWHLGTWQRDRKYGREGICRELSNCMGRPLRPRRPAWGSRTCAVEPCRPRERDSSSGHTATANDSTVCGGGSRCTCLRAIADAPRRLLC